MRYLWILLLVGCAPLKGTEHSTDFVWWQCLGFCQRAEAQQDSSVEVVEVDKVVPIIVQEEGYSATIVEEVTKCGKENPEECLDEE